MRVLLNMGTLQGDFRFLERLAEMPRGELDRWAMTLAVIPRGPTSLEIS
jgi:hypothetical protein